MGIEHKRRAEKWAEAAEVSLTAHDRASSPEDKAGHRSLAQTEASLAATNAMLYLADKLGEGNS